MLTEFSSELWLAGGPAVEVFGFSYPTRMAILRLTDGGLFVWSPIALTDALRRAVDALGPVRHIVAPNSLHHLSLPDWQAAYPRAKVHAAPGLRRKRRDIRFDTDLGDAPHPDWDGQIAQVVIRGNLITKEVVFFHRQSRTALFTDLLQQFPPGWFSGWRQRIARLDLMVAPEPSVPRKFRLAFTNRSAARSALRQVLDWPVEHVVMAHGSPVTEDGNAFLIRAFRWLGR